MNRIYRIDRIVAAKGLKERERLRFCSLRFLRFFVAKWSGFLLIIPTFYGSFVSAFEFECVWR